MDEHVYAVENKAEENVGLPDEILNPLRQKAKEQGMWAPHMPASEGGLGIGVVGLALVNEVLGRSPIGPLVFGCAAPDAGNLELLHLYGTPEQKERYLKPNLAGEVRSCFAMTEPGTSGSDPTLLQTRAIRDGNDWVINGHKWFITGAKGSKWAIIMAVTDPEAPRHQRASMFLAETNWPGFHVVRQVPCLASLAPGGECEVRFDNLRVPHDHLLGQAGEGFKLAQARLGPGRIQHCMRWLGVAQRSFELMCRRSLTRFSAGSVLAEKQTVQNWIADSAADIQAARLLTLHAAWKMDQKQDARVEISLIKFWGARVLHDVIDRAIQVHGALGYSSDVPLESFYRMARAARIYDGPDEVHRISVARRILKQFRDEAATAANH